MLETFILKNLKDGVSAVLDYYPKYDSIKIVYNIKCIDSGIYKLAAMSSLKPSSEPIILDTPEFKSSLAQGSKEVTTCESAYRGYTLTDIDTFVLALKKPDGLLPVAVHFSRLAWDFGANKFFLPASYSAESIKRAQKALDNIKTEPCETLFKYCIEKIDFFKTVFKRTHLSPSGGFDWYEVCDKTRLSDISAYRHALAQFDEKMSFLWGIARDGMTSLAVKDDLGFAFPNVSDCVVKNNGFYIVGVLFKKDGQYFAKIQ